jgi:hypothetical protein
MSGDGTPLTDSTASYVAWDTAAVLRRIGALTDDSTLRERPTPDGVAFARAALTTWPGDSR